MEKMLEYIREKYNPLGLTVYGSFADGSNNQNSDFDALAITADGSFTHDRSVIQNTELDLFVYPGSAFEGPYDRTHYAQVWDGRILLDTDGVASTLKNAVNQYLEAIPPKTEEENRQNLLWCRKILLRARREDMEGYFRQHWLLVDSLEIYCDLRKIPYWGPKRSLRHMEATDWKYAALYRNALESFRLEAAQKWIDHLWNIFQCGTQTA